MLTTGSHSPHIRYDNPVYVLPETLFPCGNDPDCSALIYLFEMNIKLAILF